MVSDQAVYPRQSAELLHAYRAAHYAEVVPRPVAVLSARDVPPIEIYTTREHAEIGHASLRTRHHNGNILCFTAFAPVGVRLRLRSCKPLGCFLSREQVWSVVSHIPVVPKMAHSPGFRGRPMGYRWWEQLALRFPVLI